MAQPSPDEEPDTPGSLHVPAGVDERVAALTPLIEFELRGIRNQLTRVVDFQALQGICGTALRDAVEQAPQSTVPELTSIAVRAIRSATLEYLQGCMGGEMPLVAIVEPPGASQDDVQGSPAATHARERTEALRTALRELPEHMRVVVQESFLRDRPIADIAQDLGQPEYVVVGARTEALTLLRERVAACLQEPTEHGAVRGPRREKWERAQALT